MSDKNFYLIRAQCSAYNRLAQAKGLGGGEARAEKGRVGDNRPWPVTGVCKLSKEPTCRATIGSVAHDRENFVLKKYRLSIDFIIKLDTMSKSA